jgi:hypothetical protein
MCARDTRRASRRRPSALKISLWRSSLVTQHGGKLVHADPGILNNVGENECPFRKDRLYKTTHHIRSQRTAIVRYVNRVQNLERSNSVDMTSSHLTVIPLATSDLSNLHSLQLTVHVNPQHQTALHSSSLTAATHSKCNHQARHAPSSRMSI